MQKTIVASDPKKACFHCGDICQDEAIQFDNLSFCCNGCKTVYEILSENDLCAYYDLEKNAGISLKSKNLDNKYDYLLDIDIVNSILEFSNDKISKVSFLIPNVHCSSCVWLLENLHKVKAGVLYSRLNFIKKELSFTFNPQITNLKEIVELLDTLGYPPSINLDNSEPIKEELTDKKLIKKIGLVGFCVGNIMLLSFPEYFHFNLANNVDKIYQKFFLYLNFILSLPVFFYGGSDYLKSAYLSLKEFLLNNSKILSVDIPIAIGLCTLFFRSTYETFINQSSGYWDSLAGLIFFLLLGRLVQNSTFSFLKFERNFKSFFPLAVQVVSDTGITSYVNVLKVKKGDILAIHNHEIIPTDSILISNSAAIDYSFVTGESELITIQKSEKIQAGGRLIGSPIQVFVEKEVSQSYLTGLWNNELFQKKKEMPSTVLADSFSKYFTYITLILALLSAIYWYFVDKSMIFSTSTAVLMVACPCALTLSMPFAMNTAMGILGKNKFFVKNSNVIQWLSEINHIVFDKTGTLTHSTATEIKFIGQDLNTETLNLIKNMTESSVHPLSKIISNSIPNTTKLELKDLKELPGFGISASYLTNLIRIGSSEFVLNKKKELNKSKEVYFSIDGICLGYFEIKSRYRDYWKETLTTINKSFKISLISGDNDAEKETLRPFFNKNQLLFNQKPIDKLNYINQLQNNNDCVAMIGDGLNDAGSLRQSNIGIALSDDIQAFTPSCDIILDAKNFKNLPKYISFSKATLTIVKFSFLLSLVYNFIGLSWALSGKLSPVMAAIFMPLSSISVVLFAVVSTIICSKIILNK